MHVCAVHTVLFNKIYRIPKSLSLFLGTTKKSPNPLTHNLNQNHFRHFAITICHIKPEFINPIHKERREMGWRWWAVGIVVVAMVLGGRQAGKQYGLDKEAIVELFRQLSDQLGFWAIPVYVLVHTLTLALCLPYAIFFEAGASLLFGFFPAVLCVFSAKILAASLSFWIGRLIFLSSRSAREWVEKNKHFHVLARGVEKDGWRFVLLARFSPVPSYVINYALAATKVRFVVDFLLPTVIGCLPMILQNTSLGSLAGAAVASASGSQKSKVGSYVFPLIGMMSSIFITLRIKKYSKDISLESSVGESNTKKN